MSGGFDKRMFTPRVFLGDLWFLTNRIPRIVSALRNRDVTRQFVEKIMMVTTAVNRCVYCEWFHARQAIESGLDDRQVRDILGLQFHAHATDFEIPALLYAQHYADTNRNPDAAFTNMLAEAYGERIAEDIMLFIRMIFFGNLFGNTWDAVLSRLRGKPAEDGNVVFEFCFFLLAVWFMAPAMVLRKQQLGGRVGVDDVG